MVVPEVKFVLPIIKSEAGMLFSFCYNNKSTGLDWSEIIYKKHPRFKEMVIGITKRDEFYNKCYEYADSFIKENHKVLEENRIKFEKSWNEDGEKALVNLSKDFEVRFPEEVKEIKANVSINPICPRYLDKWSFDFFYKFSIDKMRATCIHEIIHFLYFKKWLEVFPSSDRRTFDAPYPEWKLSEILAPSIINNNKIIQSFVKSDKLSDVYPNWQAITIDNRKLVDYFGDIYKAHEDGKISFADFLKKSWDEYNKHKTIIEV
jgi:hypothetical protein